MHAMLAFFTLSSLLIPAIHAAGRISFSNNCNDVLYLHPSNADRDFRIVVETNVSYSESQRNGTRSFDTAVLYKDSPLSNVTHFNFAFTAEGGNISYSLTQVAENNYIGGRTVEVIPSNPSCMAIRGGGYPGINPKNSAQTCQGDTDLRVTFCPGYCLSGGNACSTDTHPGPCCAVCVNHSHCYPA